MHRIAMKNISHSDLYGLWSWASKQKIGDQQRDNDVERLCDEKCVNRLSIILFELITEFCFKSDADKSQ